MYCQVTLFRNDNLCDLTCFLSVGRLNAVNDASMIFLMWLLARTDNKWCHLIIHVFLFVIMYIIFKLIFKIMCKINHIVLKMHNTESFY